MSLFCLLQAWLPVLSSPSKPIELDGAEGNFSAGLSAQKNLGELPGRGSTQSMPLPQPSCHCSAACHSFVLSDTLSSTERYRYSPVAHVRSLPSGFISLRWLLKNYLTQTFFELKKELKIYWF